MITLNPNRMIDMAKVVINGFIPIYETKKPFVSPIIAPTRNMMSIAVVKLMRRSWVI